MKGLGESLDKDWGPDNVFAVYESPKNDMSPDLTTVWSRKMLRMNQRIMWNSRISYSPSE